MKRIVWLLLVSFLVGIGEVCGAKPKLVVQIVVGGLRYDYIKRFGDHFSDDGFKHFLRSGAVFTDSRFDYMQTLSPAGLATITTGANPSTHGVVSVRWADNITGKSVGLINDSEVTGHDSDAGVGSYSNVNLIAPTLGDRLALESPKSRVITIASDPVSAIVMGGFGKDVYWVDPNRYNWISSTAYMNDLPKWLVEYNSKRSATQYLNYSWQLSQAESRYYNSKFSQIDIKETNRYNKILSVFDAKKKIDRDFERILYAPAANALLVDFAKQVIIDNKMGNDHDCDLLNICFDTPRYIVERYGSSSMEFEDMLYRLDGDISELVGFIFAQIKSDDVVIVLTADHGTCDQELVRGVEPERFNSGLFRMLLGGYLSAQYGAGDWVVDYCDRQVYLNRNLMYQNKLNPAEVQEKAATFALQFRGISNAATSSAIQKGYYGDDGVKMQNSFYPRRGGDLTLNLMPGWIEGVEDKVSLSGSLYGYDTHVPLMFLGGGIKHEVVKRSVDIKDVAPTLSRIMQLDLPVAATGKPIEEIFSNFK